MELIYVVYYIKELDKYVEKSTTVEAFGLKDAIDIVRHQQDYKCIVVAAEYEDVHKLISSLQ